MVDRLYAIDQKERWRIIAWVFSDTDVFYRLEKRPWYSPVWKFSDNTQSTWLAEKWVKDRKMLKADRPVGRSKYSRTKRVRANQARLKGT